MMGAIWSAISNGACVISFFCGDVVCLESFPYLCLMNRKTFFIAEEKVFHRDGK